VTAPPTGTALPTETQIQTLTQTLTLTITSPPEPSQTVTQTQTVTQIQTLTVTGSPFPTITTIPTLTIPVPTPTPSLTLCDLPCIDEILKTSEDILTLLQGLDLALISRILSKFNEIEERLGDPPPGGIAGQFKTLEQYFHEERIFQEMSYIVVLHNAIMLNNGVDQVLFNALSQGAKPADIDGNPINAEPIVKTRLNEFVKTIFQVSTLNEITTKLGQYVRTYQATANKLDVGRQLMRRLQDGAMVTLDRITDIANALKRDGVVGEKAYPWFSHKAQSFHTKGLTTLGIAGLVTSLFQIIQPVKSKSETERILRQQAAEMERSIREDIQDPRPENDPLALRQQQSKEDSQTPPISDQDIFPD
jgi:hypothetical protein